jgi:hypothetical protein
VPERIVLAIAGVILIHPAGLQDLPAALAIIGVGVLQWYTRGRGMATGGATRTDARER